RRMRSVQLRQRRSASRRRPGRSATLLLQRPHRGRAAGQRVAEADRPENHEERDGADGPAGRDEGPGLRRSAQRRRARVHPAAFIVVYGAVPDPRPTHELDGRLPLNRLEPPQRGHEATDGDGDGLPAADLHHRLLRPELRLDGRAHHQRLGLPRTRDRGGSPDGRRALHGVQETRLVLTLAGAGAARVLPNANCRASPPGATLLVRAPQALGAAKDPPTAKRAGAVPPPTSISLSAMTLRAGRVEWSRSTSQLRTPPRR